jgi:glycosyltransferase involved in cell wall biosynthesis
VSRWSWGQSRVVPEYSFVIPVLNERDTLPELHRRLAAVMDELDGSAEVVFVDDGSTDGSFAILQEMHGQDPRIKVVRLSRNFGHQIALTAGLDHALGRAVIIMDADLQDPPEVAIELARRWREGYDVVYAVREERNGESRFKLTTAKWFYRLMGRMSGVPIPVDAGDFRLVDRRAVDAVASMREHSRYLRGMFAWVGYDQTGVPYERSARFAGKTKFPLRKMVSFATDGVISFSAVPLRLALALGFFVSAVSTFAGILAIVLRLFDVYTVPGWASIVVGMSFLGGVQLTVLGVMGAYIARIYEEVKQRPLYLVRDRVGGEGGSGPPRGGSALADATEWLD